MKPATPPADSALGQTIAWLRSLPRLRLLPIRDAIRSADGDSLKADAIAGLTVALLAFPMALAFATKAGLPVWCGIVATGVAAIAAPLFSVVPLPLNDPTNASAALLVGAFAAVGATVPEMRVALLPALLLMTGGFILLTAWLRLGGFADFIPRTVIAAYSAAPALRVTALQLPDADKARAREEADGRVGVECAGHGQVAREKLEEEAAADVAAAAIRVTVLQLPVALGVPVEPDATPFEMLWRIATAGRELLNPNLMVALGTLSVFILVRRTRDTGPAILSAVATAAFFAMIAENVALSQGYAPRQGLFTYVGGDARIPGELTPDFSFRTFSLLFSPALALAVLIVIETTANARASALKTGRPADMHQELLGVGAANLACAAGSGLPASGSISRSALNIKAGARSGLASVATGAVILAVGSLAGGIVAKVPLAALAVLVIAAERELVNLPVVRLILRSGTQDRAAFLVTLITALIAPLDIAIFLGTAVAVAFYLRQTSVPEVVEYTFGEGGELRRREPGKPTSSISILHVAGSLHFGATQAFHDHLRRATADPALRALILKFREAEHLDANGVLLLRDVATILRRDGRHLILCEITPGTRRVLVDAGLVEVLGENHLIPDDPSNPTRSMAEAVRLARSLTGEGEAVLRVLTAPHPELPESAASGRQDWQI